MSAQSRGALTRWCGGTHAVRDAGAATVLALSVVVVVLAVTTGALVVGSVVVASHRARLASDLGSLAGATVLQDDGSSAAACALARRIAAVNGAVTQTCSVSGPDVELTVAVGAALWPAPATARSRAGPER